ncbi:MAG: HDOD domain-containing protein [bacterium]
MTIINEILTKIDKIPVLSRSASLLLNVISKEDHTIAEVNNIVENDSVLSTKVLTVINSAAYSLTTNTTSIERAVSYLGDSVILNIALESCGASKLLDKPLEGYECEGDAFWSHNIKTAIAAKHIACFALKETEASLAYTAGIIHDIGKSIISTYLINQSAEIVKQLDCQSINDYVEAERTILGTDHCEVGYNIGKHWNLPEVFLNVNRWHHNPVNCPEEYISTCYIIHLADIMAMLGGSGTGIDSLEHRLDSKYEKYIKLPGEEFDKLFFKIENEFEKIKSSFEEQQLEKVS